MEKSVICIKSELGLIEEKTYKQVNEYTISSKIKIRVVIVEGREKNFEYELFKDL